MFDGPHHQVRRIERNLARAFAFHLDGEAGLRCLHDDLVVETQRKTKAVEAGPEVGAGGRDDGRGRQPGRQNLGHATDTC